MAEAGQSSMASASAASRMKPPASTSRTKRTSATDAEHESQQSLLEALDETRELPPRHSTAASALDRDALREARWAMMRAHWRMLTDAHAIKTVQLFIKHNGYCPYCEFGEIGMTYQLETFDGVAPHWHVHLSGLPGEIGLAAGNFNKHFSRKHPKELEVLRAGILPDFLSTWSMQHMSETQLDNMATVMDTGGDVAADWLGYEVDAEELADVMEQVEQGEGYF